MLCHRVQEYAYVVINSKLGVVVCACDPITREAKVNFKASRLHYIVKSWFRKGKGKEGKKRKTKSNSRCLLYTMGSVKFFLKTLFM